MKIFQHPLVYIHIPRLLQKVSALVLPNSSANYDPGVKNGFWDETSLARIQGAPLLRYSSILSGFRDSEVMSDENASWSYISSNIENFPVSVPKSSRPDPLNDPLILLCEIRINL